jgi:hypothetical protein
LLALRLHFVPDFGFRISSLNSSTCEKLFCTNKSNFMT